MKRGTIFQVIWLGLILTILTACGAPEHIPAARPLTGVSVWIPDPNNNSMIPLGVPIPLTAVGTATRSSITRFTFFANGRSIGAGTLNSRNPAFEESDIHWVPSAPGEYWLQAQVSLATGETALSDPVRVCVFNFYPPNATYSGPCQLPTRIPSAPDTGPVTIDTTASPDKLILFPPDSACTSNLNLTFVAQVSDIADQVGFVYVHLDGGDIILRDFILNWITSRPGNVKEYRTTIDLAPYFAGRTSLPDTTINWQVNATRRLGDVAAHQNGSVLVLSAQCSQQHLESITGTPPSCPPGTYLAPSSGQCVQIQIVTPNPNSSNGNKCPAGQKWTCTGISHQTCSCQ